MSKLVDKERLAKLAQALDARMKAAVKAENERAVAAEQKIEAKADGNAAAINAINDEKDGILAQAKGYVDGIKDNLQGQIDDKVDENIYAADLKELQDADDAMAGDLVKVQSAVETLQTQMGEGNFGALDSAIKEATQSLTAEDERLAGLIDGHKGRIETVEGKVQAIEQADFAKQIKDEEDARKLADQGLETRIKANEDFVAAHDDSARDQRITDLENLFKGDNSVDAKIAAVQKDVDDNEAAQNLVNENLQGQINGKVAQADYEAKMALLDAEDQDFEARLAKLEGGEEVDGSVAKAVKVEADRAKEVEEGLEGRIAANEGKLAVVQGNEAQEGSIAKALKDAKDYADAEITKLVNSAPEAMDTLGELAQAIKDHGDAYTAYITTVNNQVATAKQEAIDAAGLAADNKDAALKAVLQKEIDDDVKVEETRALAQEAAIRQEFAAADTKLKTDLQAEIDADVKVVQDELDKQKNVAIEGSLAKQIADEVARAKAEEADIRADFKVEDDKLAAQIKAVEEMLGVDSGEGETGAFAQVQADIAQLKQDVDAVEEDIVDLGKEDVRLQGEIDKKVAQTVYDTKVQALEQADSAMAGRIDAVEEFVEGHSHEAMESDIEDLKEFVVGHDHEVMEQGIAANAKAIEDNRKACQDEMAQEVLDRNAAIAEALEPYSTTEEMKVMLGNIVNSLALSFEDNKMMLKLGGAEGITIHETSLDMATDADIEAIIAGLDA